MHTKALTSDHVGNVTGIVGVIVDVTERNRSQCQLQEAKRLAEAANRAKSNFLANMSHEIRTPMNGVLGMIELASELATDPVQQNYLNLAKSSGQTLMVVINDILDISKIEANRVDIEAVEFSLVDQLQKILNPVQAMVMRKGLVFELVFSPGLPSRVMGDPTRLRQVLLNLCDNAVKFTQAGLVAVHVSGAPDSAGGFDLTVAVSDTGIGIAHQQQSAVFELFTQADAGTTRQFGGSGLGLTISMKLAALMGGGITLKSEPGQGSTFTLQIRLALVQEAPQAQNVPAPVPAQESLALPPMPMAFQVLLVEDNLVNQILCRTILKKIGHTVVLANNGQEALDLFNQQHWDVILMDMQMPVMDGLDATRAIRALEKAGQHTPIVAMTANAMESDRQLCLDAGMDDYLSKPFKFGELRAILEKAVRQNLPLEA
jgi:CheY-like chemotaxis protein